MSKKLIKSPWGLDNLKEKYTQSSEDQQDEIRKLCSVYAAVFNSSEGRKILDILKKTLDKPTWSPEMDERYGYFREGQNDIIRHIIARVNLAKEM